MGRCERRPGGARTRTLGRAACRGGGRGRRRRRGGGRGGEGGRRRSSSSTRRGCSSGGGGGGSSSSGGGGESPAPRGPAGLRQRRRRPGPGEAAEGGCVLVSGAPRSGGRPGGSRSRPRPRGERGQEHHPGEPGLVRTARLRPQRTAQRWDPAGCRVAPAPADRGRMTRLTPPAGWASGQGPPTAPLTR